MKSNNNNNKSASEYAICLILLLGLIGIVFGVLVAPVLYVSADENFKGKANSQAKLSYVLPDGIKYIIYWQSYPAARIYEKIDGRATLFEEYGVIRLDFASVKFGNEEFDIYVYVMKSGKGALGVYLAEQPENGKSLSIGTIAEQTDTVVRVCKGQVYFTIIALNRRADIFKAITIAKSLCKSLKQKDSTLDIFSILPKRGMLTSSLSLNKDDTFGLQSLAGTISADYNINGLQFTYFVKELKSIEQKKDLIRELYDELKEFDAERLKLKTNKSNKLSKEYMLECNLFDKHLLVMTKYKYLFGIYGKMASGQARDILTRFIAVINLSGQERK